MLTPLICVLSKLFLQLFYDDLTAVVNVEAVGCRLPDAQPVERVPILESAKRGRQKIASSACLV